MSGAAAAIPVYRLVPRDGAIRALKAEALQAMGRVTPAHTVRSWYMTQARALRGEVDVPRLQFASPRVLATSAPADTMSQYRVRIDPGRSGRMPGVVSTASAGCLTLSRRGLGRTTARTAAGRPLRSGS